MGTNGKLAGQNDGALVLRIKRASSTDDGMVFGYLSSHRQPQTELACEAMRSYWLPLALKQQGLKGKELKSVGLKAIAQLMQQIEIIRLECGLRPDEMPFGDRSHISPGVAQVLSVAVPTVRVPSVPTPTAPSQAFEDNDQNFVDDDFLDDGAI